MKYAVCLALLAWSCADPAFDPGDGGRPRPDAAFVSPGFDQGPGPAPPGCAATPEVCDGFDNDCDGQVDEIACPCTGSATCFAGPPEARGIGVCTEGTRRCDPAGESFGPCEGSVGPSIEACNGLDDDCDGTVDERCDDPGAGGAGGVGGAGGAGGGGGPVGPRFERFVVGERRDGPPVDFVMVVDNSGSMEDTVAQVEGNLGAFATRLVQAGIDYRLVLVSERGTRGGEPDVCIPPPMAGPNCADSERFRHIDESVDSEEPYEDIVKCWNGCGAGIQSFLRPGSLLQLIVVTDDESDMSWVRFRANLEGFGRPDFRVHAIVGLRDEGCVADVGNEYIRAAQETGGALLHICDNDWGQVIQVLFDATTVELQRTFTLRGTPDPATLQVFVLDAGGFEVEQRGNWQYDPVGNAIVFDEGNSPPAGAIVVVRYTAI